MKSKTPKQKRQGKIRQKINRLKPKFRRGAWLEQAKKFHKPWYRRVPYQEFLATDYWMCIKNHLYETRGEQCQQCGSGERLQIHHKTYAFRGREHEALHTLKILCRRCHRLEHL